MLFYVYSNQTVQDKLMKINRMLIAVLAMLAVVLSSCKDDDPTVGIDSGMPAPSVFYDAANSAGKTIAVYWNPMQAISAGATSFTVQLVKSEDGAGDVYDNTISQTLASVDKDNQPADKAKFENLAKGRIYYVRVRANYPRSVYSPWILAASSEEDSTTARIKVGEGLVGPEAGESSDIETRFIGSTESSVSIAWSTCDTWTANDLDKSLPYRLELFADDKCTDLVVAWNAPANLPDGTSTKNAVFKLGTRFSFSNLNPETSYWARVTNTADNVVSEPVECKTGKSNYKAMPAAATVDEIILFQDFHELVYGGNPIDAAAGVSTTKKGSGEQFWPLRGDDPTKDTEKGLVLCSGDREIGLFNTLKSSVAASTTLQDWGRMYEDKSTTSKENGAICARQGLLKMGAGSYRGCVVTPELKCLTQPATIELSFKASAFDGGDENQTILVHLLDDTQIDGSYWVTAASKTQVGTGATGTKADGWKDFTFTIENVTATSRIAIGGENGGGSTQHRFLLDDIQIKLLSYGSVDVDLDAPVVTVESTPITITATWGAVQSARSYTVEYKKTANADWTLAGETGETSFKIENLDSETSYDVRVKATAGDSESEYSEIKTIETLKITGTVTASLIKATESQLMVSWTANNGDTAADIADDWKIELYKDAACSDLDVAFEITASSKLFSWGTKWPAPQPAFIFSGLDAEKDYWFKVTNMTKAISTTEKYTTTKSYVKEIPATPAVAGDVILYEDFSEFLWGSEPVYGCAGYSSNYRTTCTSIDKATGADPLTTDGPDGAKKLYYMVKEGTNMGLFNTLAGAIPTTRLKNWGVLIEKNQVGALLSGVGYLKLGAASDCGTIVTPELSCLSGKAKIKVSFDASPYQEVPKMDPLTMKILVIDGASSIKVEKGGAVPGMAGTTYSGACVNVITGGTTTVAQTFSLSSTYGYASYSYEISGVTSTSRIAIATDRNDVAGQHRCYLDNIKIEVVAYE